MSEKENKYKYTHCIDSNRLICIDTKEIVPVNYPTSIEITNIPNIVKIREQEAIEKYEKFKAMRKEENKKVDNLERFVRTIANLRNEGKENITFEKIDDKRFKIWCSLTIHEDGVHYEKLHVGDVGLNECSKRWAFYPCANNEYCYSKKMLVCVLEKIMELSDNYEYTAFKWGVETYKKED